ncbi:uncharacterized protein I206_107144 [Kwoniella pini CBS 10737]|uniref:Uncharacterized protein n=1 Tax=Kwoniella pini CBS 10737 TaxID=1296096 RepID=A0A1B9HZ19_9TREE|nr:uncharacterized protein I206_05312 [Kwoniella pini CBS 10737]OCF48533.1 hypothetical protein I206_05312 [Kwoniella pini CBS 10737]
MSKPIISKSFKEMKDTAEAVTNSSLRSTVLATQDLTNKVTSINWKETAHQAKGYIHQGGQAAMEYAKEHPYQTAGIVGTTVVVACPTLVVGPVLSAVGMTSNGVSAGSIAAGIQSTIGNVQTGSLYATLQSAAAGGGGLGIVNVMTQAGAAASNAAMCGVGYWKDRGRGAKL